MRSIFRLLACFAVALSALTAPALAEEASSAPMKRILPYYENFMDIPESERSLIRIVYRIKSRSLPESDIRAWYTLNGEKVDLTLNNRGELISLPDMETYRANPAVSTNISRNDAVLALRVRPNVAMTKTIDAATLTASLAQADKGLRRVSGMFAFLRPTLKGYRIEIRSGETAEMVLPNGEVRPLTVKYIDPNVSHVDVDRKELAGAKSLRFSASPMLIKYRE